MRRILCLTLSLAVLPALQGCIAMYRGTSQEITITSSPSGARFQFGEHTGTTPATITVDRARTTKQFQCGMVGYAQAAFSIDYQNIDMLEDPVGAFVAIFSGLLIIPGIIDIAMSNGANYPPRIHADLAKQDSGGISTVKFPGPDYR